MAEDTTPHRWPRFKLSTILVLVALAALPMAWLSQEYAIVAKRKSLISMIERQPHAVVLREGNQFIPHNHNPEKSAIEIPYWRRWMGDEKIVWVFLQPSLREQAARIFPEAVVMPLGDWDQEGEPLLVYWSTPEEWKAYWDRLLERRRPKGVADQ